MKKATRVTIYEFVDRIDEKKYFFTKKTPVFKPLTVEIPYPVWRTVKGEIGLDINGQPYLLKQLLTNCGGEPTLKWYATTHFEYKRLKIVE